MKKTTRKTRTVAKARSSRARGSAPALPEILNALDVLNRAMRYDDELIFTEGRLFVFRDHLHTAHEIAALLAPEGKPKHRFAVRELFGTVHIVMCEPNAGGDR